MDIGLAGDRGALLVQDGIGGAGHDAELVLELVPALDAAGGAVVLLQHAADRHGHGSDGADLLGRAAEVIALGDPGELDLDIGGAVALILGERCLHAAGELGQGHGHALDAKAFEELALVAHGGVELIGARPDLEDAGSLEGLHDIADSDEVTKAPLEDRIVHPAVRQVREGDAEAAQDLARGEKAALGVTQAGAVSLGTLVERAPEQHGLAEVLREAGADELRAKVAVGEEQPVHAGFLELLQDLEAVVLVVEQPLLVDILDIDELDAELAELVGDDGAVLAGIRCAEDAAARRRIAQDDAVHAEILSLGKAGCR